MPKRRELCPECGQHTGASRPVVRLNVNVDADVYDQFQQAAKAKGKFVSDAIRELIEGYVGTQPTVVHHDGRRSKETTHG